LHRSQASAVAGHIAIGGRGVYGHVDAPTASTAGPRSASFMPHQDRGGLLAYVR
jgi:hypothetical protein